MEKHNFWVVIGAGLLCSCLLIGVSSCEDRNQRRQQYVSPAQETRKVKMNRMMEEYPQLKYLYETMTEHSDWVTDKEYKEFVQEYLKLTRER